MILAEIKALGVEPQSIAHILITHHDVDHVGNAAALRQATGAKIWTSAADRPYVEGSRHRPATKRIAELLVRPVPPQVDAVFAEENPELDLVVVPTPGHTPGHVVFLYQDILFAGDLVVSQNGRLKPSPAVLTWNQAALRDSIRRVQGLSFRYICPAHGQPLERGTLWEQLG